MNLWSDWTPPQPTADRSAPTNDVTTDVCIVGGGLSGLWTAYYLARADPTLSITVLEKHTVGFGASGRNGGWCSALFPRSAASLERRYGFERAVAMRQAMIDTVGEVGAVAAAEGIHCDFIAGGTVVYAMNGVQKEAALADVREAARFGVDELRYVDASAGQGSRVGNGTGTGTGDPVPGPRVGAHGALGATFDPACARVHPAKLVHGLARVVEGLGVRIHEQTAVTGWEPGAVRFEVAAGEASRAGSANSSTGVVHTGRIVIATEAYGSQLPGVGRRILPLYSLMIATEPLPDEFWESAALAHGQTFSDYRHLLIYGQRTADNRFAFGGRGARYHLGSSIRPSYDHVDRVFAHLHETLGELFPDARSAAVTHRWGGPLGVPRDWHASAAFNPRTGIAYAGGYVGDGLSTTNLAGRTLTALMTGTRPGVTPASSATDLTALPWVNHLSPRWEPEPLRFIGANLGLASAALADTEERLTGRASLTARLLGPLTGH